MKPSILAGLLSASMLAGPSFAETIGAISSVSGDEGAVILVRDGRSVSVSPGDALETSDRVVVRGNGTAVIEAFDCAKTLEAPAMVVLEAAFCDMQVVALPQAAPASETAATGARQALNVGADATIAAGAGVASLAALVSSSGDGSSTASATAATGLTDGGTAAGSVRETGTPQPVSDVPASALVSSTFEVGSGLDTGLFGFFEATSS